MGRAVRLRHFSVCRDAGVEITGSISWVKGSSNTVPGRKSGAVSTVYTAYGDPGCGELLNRPHKFDAKLIECTPSIIKNVRYLYVSLLIRLVCNICPADVYSSFPDLLRIPL